MSNVQRIRMHHKRRMISTLRKTLRKMGNASSNIFKFYSIKVEIDVSGKVPAKQKDKTFFNLEGKYYFT